MQNNDKDRRRELTDMNNQNDTQTSIAQGHTINNTPNSHEDTRIIGKASTNGHIDKTDENINIQIMADQAENWIGLNIIRSYTNIVYIQTINILYSVNDRHYILEH